jgi:hypothetical protein
MGGPPARCLGVGLKKPYLKLTLLRYVVQNFDFFPSQIYSLLYSGVISKCVVG